MKKTILAVVTTSLFAASANAAVVFDKDGQQLGVYGELRYMAGQRDTFSSTDKAVVNGDAKVGEADNFGGYSRVRLGVDGKWATGYNDVSLIAKQEWQVASSGTSSDTTNDGDTSGTFDSRYSYVGADFGNGVQAVVGSVPSPYKQLTNTTDIYEYYSGSVEDQSVHGDIWSDGVAVTYAADGWDLRSAVSASDEEKTRSDLDSDGYKTQSRYGVSAGYTIQIDDVSSLKPVLAYQAEEGKVAGTNYDYTDSQYAAGLGYTYDAFYLASTYGQAKHDVDTQDTTKDTVWSVVTSYKVLPEWTVLANYAIVDPHNAGANGSPSGEYGEYYVLGTQYDITAKAKAFAEYKINQVEGQDDTYLVGLQYTF